ncbi:MAG: hypothetical protein E5V77_06520 [Mesorhizobium sp.]|nr:MAG: hypothetical protein E5V77_06520 [Mesorhizobium sp.]
MAINDGAYGMQKVDFLAAGQRTLSCRRIHQFDIHRDGGALWNILKAATARATQTRDASSASEATH